VEKKGKERGTSRGRKAFVSSDSSGLCNTGRYWGELRAIVFSPYFHAWCYFREVLVF
jgi:hypothetical protein